VPPALKYASGFSLSELLVVISVMVLLIGIGIPAAKQITDSFESSAGLRSVISAALSNARAIAIKNQKYAGLRFQQDQNGRGYMIFIVHDPADSPTAKEIDADPDVTGTGLANGFRAVKGLKPIKLPANAGVMDLRVKTDYPPTPSTVEEAIVADGYIDDPCEFNDTATFSIIFSPAGKLVIHEARIRNRHGRIESTETVDYSNDDVFNTSAKADAGGALFYQDDYAGLGLGQEHSRNHFVIYDKRAFAAIDTNSKWTDYLSKLEVLYINPYTGEIINKD
jgi:type II secretory pathway pseudopilin PulG